LAQVRSKGGTDAEYGSSCCRVEITWLVWTTPQFALASLIGLGLPLYLVTMASHNLPGFAVLRQAGYEPPVTPGLWTTGLGRGGSPRPCIKRASIVLAPFGGDHGGAHRRWRVAQPYFVISPNDDCG